MSDAAFTRREALTGLSALSLTACAGRVGPTTASPPGGGEGLHAIAARKGLRFGSAIAYGVEGSDSGSIGNPAYRTIIERECGLVVAENEMKWQAIRPAPDPAQHLPAVNAGQQDVEDDGGGAMLPCPLEARLPRGHGMDRVAVGLEILPQEADRARVVLDHEDGRTPPIGRLRRLLDLRRNACRPAGFDFDRLLGPAAKEV